MCVIDVLRAGQLQDVTRMDNVKLRTLSSLNAVGSCAQGTGWTTSSRPFPKNPKILVIGLEHDIYKFMFIKFCSVVIGTCDMKCDYHSNSDIYENISPRDGDIR